jgi:hypothetical protein
VNRRSFITKALAAVAVVPVVGKLVNSQPNAVQRLPILKGPLPYAEQSYVLGSPSDSYLEQWIRPLPAYRRVTITLSLKAFRESFPFEHYFDPPRNNHYFRVRGDFGDHKLILMSYSFYDDQVKIEGGVVECSDDMSCGLGCDGPSFGAFPRFNKGDLTIRLD